MSKKNKVLLALAIGAMLILVASTVTRCTWAHQADQLGQIVPVENEQLANSANPEQNSEEDHAATITAETDPMAMLQQNVWTSTDGQAHIAFKEGRFVESDQTTTKLTTFDVVSTDTRAEQTTLIVSIDQTDGTSKDAMIALRQSDNGVLSVASDSFQPSPSYTQGAHNDKPLEIEGVNDEFRELLGGTTDALGQALSEYAQTAAPASTKATWSKELVVDYNTNTVSANFVLDDPASSVLTVEYARASNTFAVMG